MDNKEKKNNIFIWAIIALLIVIAVMGFFLGKNSASNSNPVVAWDYQELTLTVIGDERCGEKCPTNAILDQLKQLPSVSASEIVVKDFSDEGIAEYLKDNDLNTLPLFIFSTNNFDTSKDPVQLDQSGKPVPKLNTFLETIKDGQYSLSVWATFNPFETRSERGFLMLDNDKLQAVKDSSYIKGNKDAKITWIEYSDLECPFCAKLHNAGTVEALTEKYGDDLNIMYNHFPLGFHKNAQVWAEILECLAEQKGSDAFYSLIKTSYTNINSDKSFLIKEAVVLWADEDKLNKCLDDATYTQKVKDMQNAWGQLFGITGTPGNVLINNETGEYEIISWAYPTDSFIELIDRLIK